MQFDRRQLLRSAAALAAMTSPFAGMDFFAFGQSVHADENISGEQTLFQPLEAKTLALLDTYFPGYRALPSTNWLLPYTAVVRNAAMLPVKAYKFRWVTEESVPERTLFTTTFVSRPSNDKRSPLATGWNSLLQPGQYAVLSPLFLWSQKKFARSGRNGMPVEKFLTKSNQAATFISRTDTTVQLRVRRDLKVSGHCAIGRPTHASVLFQATVNYERSLARAIMSKVAGASNFESVIDELKTTIGAKSVTVSRRVKLQYLSSVSARIAHHGPEYALSSVRKIADLPDLVLDIKKRVHLL